MGVYRVDLDLLDDNIARMAAFEKSIERRLATLQQEIDDLHLSWTGLAASAQKAAHEQWSKGEAQMRQALVELRKAAEVAHHNYSSAAAANVRMWHGVG